MRRDDDENDTEDVGEERDPKKEDTSRREIIMNALSTMTGEEDYMNVYLPVTLKCAQKRVLVMFCSTQCVNR